MIGTKMKKHFNKGQWVISRFRAPWKGQIVEDSQWTEGCYIVRIMIDRHDNPMRKPKLMEISSGWLEPIKEPQRHL